nr:FHA domain-containing protein [Cellulosimicrobium arenosum]
MRYETGSAHALVRGGAVVVLPEPAGHALVETLWEQLGDDPGVVEVLQVLTGAFGSSLRTLPPFAVAVVDGRRVHVAVRGDMVVSLEQEDAGTLHVGGVDVTTWSERVVDDVLELVVRVGVRVPDVQPGRTLLGDVRTLPLGTGVVLVEAVGRELAPRPPAPVTVPPSAAEPPVVPVPDAPPEPTSASEETIAPEREPSATEPPVGADVPLAPLDTAPDLDDRARDEAAADDDYAHLWGSTVMRTVEDAAIRVDDSEAPDEDESSSAPASAPAGTQVPVPPVPAPGPDTAAPAPPSGAAAPAPPSPDALIAGVPREWTGATPAAALRASTVGPDGASAAAEGTGEDDDGTDHDGHTVLSSAIADLRAAASQDAVPDPTGPAPAEALPEPSAPPMPPVATFSVPPEPGQVQILARTCPQGHANPPSRDTCKVCDEALEGDAQLTVRPPLGRAVVSTGQSIDLDRAVVVGRRPRTPRDQAAEMPRLVTVPSPQQDVSRSHVEISLEGWHVLVADMATTNGTTLLRPGQPPRRLHPSEPVLVVDGDVVDLGDGATLTFEGIW